MGSDQKEPICINLTIWPGDIGHGGLDIGVPLPRKWDLCFPISFFGRDMNNIHWIFMCTFLINLGGSIKRVCHTMSCIFAVVVPWKSQLILINEFHIIWSVTFENMLCICIWVVSFWNVWRDSWRQVRTWRWGMRVIKLPLGPFSGSFGERSV